MHGNAVAQHGLTMSTSSMQMLLLKRECMGRQQQLGAEEIFGLQKNQNHRQDRSPQCFAILWQLSKRDAVWKWHRTCE